MDKDTVKTIAKDVFRQAEQGLAVELDPEMADALGAFTEDAVTLADIIKDTVPEADNEQE